MFGGAVRRYKHFSDSCGCDMTFSVFVPASGESCSSSTKAAAPIFLFLSGLTCNDENFTQKSGAQRAAASHGIALVAPDTSPRGLGVPGEDEGWDLGTGAGFYVDATQEPWVKQKQQKEGSSSSLSGYRMFSYVTVDLIEALKEVPGLDASKIALSGHS
jgi:S-formylglutathione hydrolase